MARCQWAPHLQLPIDPHRQLHLKIHVAVVRGGWGAWRAVLTRKCTRRCARLVIASRHRLRWRSAVPLEVTKLPATVALSREGAWCWPRRRWRSRLVCRWSSGGRGTLAQRRREGSDVTHERLQQLVCATGGGSCVVLGSSSGNLGRGKRMIDVQRVR